MEFTEGMKYRITIEGWVTGNGGEFGPVSLATDNSRITYIHPDFIVGSEELAQRPPLPANWPPQPGDLWADHNGQRWFCRAEDGGHWWLASERGDRSALTSRVTAAQLSRWAPGLYLVLRRDPEDSPAGRRSGK